MILPAHNGKNTDTGQPQLATVKIPMSPGAKSVTADNGKNTDVITQPAATVKPPMLERNKPFDTYPGGKDGDGVYQAIINQIPPHVNYIAGFAGNDAIVRHKRPAYQNILIDLDLTVIKEWQKFYNAKYTFGHSNYHYPYNGRWSHGPNDSEHFTIESIRHLLLHGSFFDLVCKNQLIKGMLAAKHTFLFLDPPYPFDSRISQRDLYRCEITNEEHVRLLKMIVKLDCMVAISSYPNSLYDRLLKDWRFIDFKGRTRHGIVTERLYMNYPEPTRLHDYSYLGENYRKRQDIKLQRERTIQKLRNLPALERNAIIEQIKREF